MKKFAYAFIALLIPALLYAQQNFAVQEVGEFDGSIYTINICTTDGALDVTNKTTGGTIAGAFAVEVYNLAASTNTVNCSFSSSLSTASASGYYGREVPKGIGVVWQIRQKSTRKLYCMTQNPDGCTRATITQIK